jgi:hypothetical protein
LAEFNSLYDDTVYRPSSIGHEISGKGTQLTTLANTTKYSHTQVIIRLNKRDEAFTDPVVVIGQVWWIKIHYIGIDVSCLTHITKKVVWKLVIKA